MSAIALAPSPAACDVSRPTNDQPRGASLGRPYGNGRLWVGLWPNGVVVFKRAGPGRINPDGSLTMKFAWWRAVRGRLEITGRRKDAAAPPLTARIPAGYGETGFQSTGLTFASEGCWEVTGRVGAATLTFVTRVVKLANARGDD
ncbi:MAG TPA: hypothetical protein VGQ78_06980 [Vicinamibacteria bacterium]|nr:hypothetical protein [Vicinamibacteria bacterium]